MSIHADSSLLETTYQIAKYIQTFVTEELHDESEKPFSEYAEYFCLGPNSSRHQTKQGLVLEESAGIPSKIHTPYGSWSILGNGGIGDWQKVMEAIKEPLGLKLMKKEEQTAENSNGPYWAITQWQNKLMDKPIYRELSAYLNHRKVSEVWQKFQANHDEMFS